MQVLDRPRIAPSLAVVVIALFAAALIAKPGVFPLDDAYITLTNARTMVGGADPFGSSYLVGASSALHLLALGGLGLALPLPMASTLLCLAAAAAYAVGLLQIGRAARGWRAYAIAGIGLMWGSAVFQLLNGLETGLAMAAVAWMLLLADNRRWLPILCGLAPFIRLELALLAVPLLLRLMWSDRSEPVRALRFPLIAAACALPWGAWYLIQTGWPIPNTASAKIWFFAEMDLPFGTKVWRATHALWLTYFFPLFAGACFGWHRTRAGWCAAVFVAAWIGLATLTIPSSLHWNDSRYVAPLIPALCYGLAGFASIRSRLSDLLVVGFSVAAIGLGLASTSRYRQVIQSLEGGKRPTEVVAALPASAVVLVHDAGWVSWANPRARLVDAVGLKSPRSANWHRRLSKSNCRWDAALDRIATDERVTHVVALHSDPFWGCVIGNLARAGWSLHPIYSEPAGYAVFRAKNGS